MKYIKLHTAAHKSHTFKMVFFCNRLLKRRLLKINVNKIEDATHPLTSPISALFLYVSSDAVRSGHYSSCICVDKSYHTSDPLDIFSEKPSNIVRCLSIYLSLLFKIVILHTTYPSQNIFCIFRFSTNTFLHDLKAVFLMGTNKNVPIRSKFTGMTIFLRTFVPITYEIPACSHPKTSSK